MSDLLTRDEIKQYLALLDTLPEGSPEIEKINALLQADKRERCRQNFMPFVRQMWSAFIPGKHHQIMADAFERVARGELKRSGDPGRDAAIRRSAAGSGRPSALRQPPKPAGALQALPGGARRPPPAPRPTASRRSPPGASWCRLEPSDDAGDLGLRPAAAR